ncbi:MAG: IS630 family transposase, partial [Pseudonocardiaceae bacterium]
MVLTDKDRIGLESLLREDGYDGSVSARAQIVLWRADGYSAQVIAEMAGTTKPTVYKWVTRYEELGLDGPVDRKSTGRPREVSGRVRARILALTRRSPPGRTGLSHWSSRATVRYLKREEKIVVSHNFVADLWREHGLQPHRQGTFKLSTDSHFEEKVIDVVGLSLDPPADAVVLSIDEKPQVQALDRTQPPRPTDGDRTAKRTHDYVRNGTTTLFAALNTATGEVLGHCFDQHRTKEFLAFMDQVAARHHDREIHVVTDNLSTPSVPDVDAWLAEHPKITFHVTRPAVRGSTKWRSGSASSPNKPSDEAPSDRYVNSSTPSTPTSTTGTATQNLSPGPPQPTTSSPKSEFFTGTSRNYLPTTQSKPHSIT